MLIVISNFIKRHPDLSDEELASSFGVEVAIVSAARAL